MTNYIFKIIANGVELETFDDEVVSVSNNVTGLFDIDKIPSDFSRQMQIPGSRKNNAFFSQFYNIDVDFPFLFQESEKIEAYFDVSGYLLVDGYLQLNKVNIKNNHIESYSITIYGSISNFSRDLGTNYLTDLTDLSVYNHTMSYTNIVDSWSGNLFGGDIVYPLVDYGRALSYQSALSAGQVGIDNPVGGLNVQDFKPMIRTKKVIDAIFSQFNFNYSSSFFDQDFFKNEVYTLCDRGLQYPVFNGVDLEGFGQVIIGPTSGSTSDTVLTAGSFTQLEFDSTYSDPSVAMASAAVYNQPRRSSLNGQIKLNFEVSGSDNSDSGSGYPTFELGFSQDSGATWVATELEQINLFMGQTYSQLDKIGAKTYTLEETWSTGTTLLDASGTIFGLRYTKNGYTDFNVTVAPSGNSESRIEISRLNEAADYRTMEIPLNMPFGSSGITCLDYLKGIQKKYNLVFTPSKTISNFFIIETFNNWYKQGAERDISQFVQQDEDFEVVPANTLAVREVKFNDEQGKDLLARTFTEEANRSFGTIFYEDTQNNFSQGTLDVKTVFSNSPLRFVNGSQGPGSGAVGYAVSIIYNNSSTTICNDGFFAGTAFIASNRGYIIQNDILYTDAQLTIPFRYYYIVKDVSSGIRFLMNVWTGLAQTAIGPC